MGVKENVEKSVFILREVKARYKNPAMLSSFGKDSTAIINLIQDAFGYQPFPVIHLDTGYKFPEMYEIRDKLQKEFGFKLIIHRNEEALSEGCSKETCGSFECCNQLKTQNLKKALAKYGFDALIVGIRRDECGVRNEENYFSPRDNDCNFKQLEVTGAGREDDDIGVVSLTDTEFSGWGIYATEYKESNHTRIHPLLHWSEKQIWEYLQKKNATVCPLYLSKNGKRFRSLGCYPCTEPVDSEASNFEEIIKEIETTQVKERSGRNLDKENQMESLRALGYM
ncbi:phosphoadenosine phosphosulfate reductase family protein [Candidatus Gracilibacteria bacterium]|nr:phosphoadenosine phosphosulfate reductase family protein [Candidatus Gracilibacteria bacterium]